MCSHPNPQSEYNENEIGTPLKPSQRIEEIINGRNLNHEWSGYSSNGWKLCGLCNLRVHYDHAWSGGYCPEAVKIYTQHLDEQANAKSGIIS